jgi:hypothetical protein
MRITPREDKACPAGRAVLRISSREGAMTTSLVSRDKTEAKKKGIMAAGAGAEPRSLCARHAHPGVPAAGGAAT